MSRYIPQEVSIRLKIRDYFRCVWCGIHLYDRHHLMEFHLGGSHILNNLVLLCPNCHRLTHKGIIDPIDLVHRSSTQQKGDRINGLITLDFEKAPIISIGNVSTIGANPIICYQGKSLLSYRISEGGELLLCYKIYNKSGQLVFWLNDNSFWTTIDFKHTNQENLFRIDSLNDEQFLQICKIDDNKLQIKGNSYINGRPFIFGEFSGIHVNNSSLSNITCISYDGFPIINIA